jgi:hypothetical protein
MGDRRARVVKECRNWCYVSIIGKSGYKKYYGGSASCDMADRRLGLGDAAALYIMNIWQT